MIPLIVGAPDALDERKSHVSNESIADVVEYIVAAEARMDAADACLRSRK